MVTNLPPCPRLHRQSITGSHASYHQQLTPLAALTIAWGALKILTGPTPQSHLTVLGCSPGTGTYKSSQVILMGSRDGELLL